MEDRAAELARVGERLRSLRQAAGQTQAQTARGVGISRQYLSEAEAGANVTLSVIYRLAEHFGVTAAFIVDNSSVPEVRNHS